ncbi:MAG: hypothetical protein WC852_00775 [Candidatus Nanoarchaeia archaeon]|jgi:hypothetical protein
MTLASIIEDINKLSNTGRISLETRQNALREVINSYRVCNQPKGYETLGCALLEKVINGQTTFADELNNARMQRQDAKFIIDNISILSGNYDVSGQVQTIDAAVKYAYTI